MKKFILATFIFATALTLNSCNNYNGENASRNAYATHKGVEGKVIDEGKNEWFIIRTSDQYVVVEAQGANNLRVKDMVYGDFYGFNGRNVYNDTKKKSYKVWVKGYFSTYDEAAKYMKRND